jgi:aspartate racemase
MKGLIGILGGMGPAATVDIFNKFVEFSTDATKDQEHIPLLISSIPDIPDRTQALLHDGETPINYMRRYFEILENGGAECVIIPCNTAHYWYDELKKTAKAHMISIIDSAIEEARRAGKKNIGMLATDATLAGNLYQTKMTQLGINCLKPTPAGQKNVMQSIYSLKAGNAELAKTLMIKEADNLFEQGAEMIICGCTEVPIILQQQIMDSPERYIDATAALVRETIRWHQTQTHH